MRAPAFRRAGATSGFGKARKPGMSAARVPIGELRDKAEARARAAKFGLPKAGTLESMDIFFIDGDYRTFVSQRAPAAFVPGPAERIDGTVVGTHAGVVALTIGQRSGVGVATGEGLYGLRFDADRAAAVVGRPFDADLAREVSGRNEEETVGSLEELTRRGLLVEVDASSYAFRHEQARRVAGDLTSSGRRRLLWGLALSVVRRYLLPRFDAPTPSVPMVDVSDTLYRAVRPPLRLSGGLSGSAWRWPR